MSYLQSIVLGIVQGLSEFLPISSSAHLVIVPWAFHFPDPGLTFDVALHFGTLFALIAYFWKDWIEILTRQHRLLLFIIIASIPAAIAGMLLEKLAESTFRSPLLIAVNMALMGGVLLWADGYSQRGKDLPRVSFWDSFLIGCSQALALVPGVSRSGITITTGLLRGLDRQTAARFSFLLAAPITAGACLLKAKHFLAANPSGIELTGIAVSALVGFLSIKYLLRFVQTFSYRIFVAYRFLFALAVIGVYYFVR